MPLAKASYDWSLSLAFQFVLLQDLIRKNMAPTFSTDSQHILTSDSRILYPKSKIIFREKWSKSHSPPRTQSSLGNFKAMTTNIMITAVYVLVNPLTDLDNSCTTVVMCTFELIFCFFLCIYLFWHKYWLPKPFCHLLQFDTSTGKLF